MVSLLKRLLAGDGCWFEDRYFACDESVIEAYNDLMPWIWPLADLVHMQITDADIKFRSRWLGDVSLHSIWLNGVWNQTRKWSAMLIINLICCVTNDIAKSVAADFQWHFSHVATSNEMSSFEININKSITIPRIPSAAWVKWPELAQFGIYHWAR